MRNIFRTIAFMAVAAVGAPNAFAGQASPIEAKLIVPDARVLPGVPFEMWIELRNPSDAPVSVGLFPSLIVHSDRGESFEISSRLDDYPVLLKGPASEGEHTVVYLTMERGEKKTLTLPFRDGVRAAQFFSDYRLSPPGRYALAVRLDPFPPGGIENHITPLTYLGPVTTSEATVERIEPTGSDAKVWRRMQELADGRWTVPITTITNSSDAVNEEMITRGKIWNEILTKYPDSGYVPYALLAYSQLPDDEYPMRVAEAVKRFPDSPVVELLQLQVLNSTAGPCARSGAKAQATCDRARITVNQSKRPTTRIRAFGNESKEPCPTEYDCQD